MFIVYYPTLTHPNSFLRPTSISSQTKKKELQKQLQLIQLRQIALRFVPHIDVAIVIAIHQ